MKKKLVSVTVAGAMALSCLTVPVLAEEDGKVLTYARASECETLDPGLCNYQASSSVLLNVFMGLYMVGEDGVTLKNGCAESYDLSEDGLTYTFHLYDDLLWSDGTALTAADFEYSWKRALLPETASTAADSFYLIKNAQAFNQGECEADEVGVTAIDDTTLEVVLENPAAYFLDITAEACFCPVQQAAVESATDWSQDTDAYVSNGAFTIAEINPEESYVLVKNENYKYADTVAIDEVDIVFIEDTSATLTAFKNGEIDLTNNISTQAQSDFADSETLQNYPTIGTTYFDFNCENFTDARVRQALSMSIDRDTITQNLVANKPESATGFVPTGISYYDSEDDYRTVAGSMITYDPENAQALLEEAVADGFDADATYSLMILNTDELKTVAQAMQAMWKASLGLNFEIVTYESGTYWDEFANGNFDVAYDGWTGDYDDPSTMLNCFTQAECATQNRWSGEQAEQYDAMIAECAAMTDQAARYEQFIEAEKILIEESPIMPLYFKVSQLLIGDNVDFVINDTGNHTLFKYATLK